MKTTPSPVPTVGQVATPAHIPALPTAPSRFACPRCAGKGEYSDTHNWSDGWGYVTCICAACNGTGALNLSALIDEALAGRNAQNELDRLRTSCALYLASEGNNAVLKTYPREPLPVNLDALRLKLAPGPSPWQSTWRDRLEKAARLAPRQA